MVPTPEPSRLPRHPHYQQHPHGNPDQQPRQRHRRRTIIIECEANWVFYGAQSRGHSITSSTTVTSRSTNTAFVTTQPTRFTPDTPYDVRVTSINFINESCRNLSKCIESEVILWDRGLHNAGRKRGFLLSADTQDTPKWPTSKIVWVHIPSSVYTSATALVPSVICRQ